MIFKQSQKPRGLFYNHQISLYSGHINIFNLSLDTRQEHLLGTCGKRQTEQAQGKNCDEENLMKAINYKDIEAHKLLHQTFYNEVVQMSKEFRNTSVQELNKELLQFLLFWFKDHILKEDFKYKNVLDADIQ